MSVENNYNLDFYQALKIVMGGQLVIVDAAACYIESTSVFIKGMARQKFRELSILTMNALCN